MSGFDNEVVNAINWDFRGAVPVQAQVTNAGELPIGTGASPAIEVGVLTSPGGSITIGYSNPNITLDMAGGGVGIDSVGVDAFTGPGTDPVVPDGAGLITVTGAQVAAGVVGTNVLRSDSLAANTYTMEIQRSTATASSTLASNGVSHFDSASFSVDANGFVELTTPALSWIDEGTGITLSINTGYFVTAAVTETLPAAPVQGDTVKIICDHAGPIVITANTGQTISLGNTSSSTAGTFTNTDIGDALELFYRDSTSEWKALNAVGNWNIA